MIKQSDTAMTKKYPRLLRRKHTFYLRIAIPRDIQHLALRKEFLYSLNTTDYLLAIKLYHIESVAMDKFITLLRVFAMRVSKRAYPILVEFDETDIDNILIHRLEEIIKFCEDNYYNIKRSLNSFNEISIFRPNSRKSMSVLGGAYHFQNALANEKHKDDVWGLRFAAGAATPVKYGQVRGEFELGWNDDAKDSNNFPFKVINTYNHKFATELSVYSAMLNVYYDIDTGTKFTPYVGGGIGMAHLKNKTKVTGSTPAGALNLGSSESENNFAWNIGAGVSYALNDKVSIDAGYRYSDYGNVKESVSQKVPGLGAPLNVDGKYDVTSHEFLIGARYAF